MKLIVAVDERWAIGQGGDQLVYLPADLKRFQALTTGHTVILGRKTLTTFPGGRPLRNRRNLILSQNPNFFSEGGEVFQDLNALLASAPEDSFVIGGESVYQALLPYCTEAYVTKIQATFPADAFFPNLDADAAWEVVETSAPTAEKDLTYCYVQYRRRVH